jgi:hypothetical protein
MMNQDNPIAVSKDSGSDSDSVVDSNGDSDASTQSHSHQPASGNTSITVRSGRDFPFDIYGIEEDDEETEKELHPLEQRAKARIAAQYDAATDSDSVSDNDSQSEQGKADPIPNGPLSLYLQPMNSSSKLLKRHTITYLIGVVPMAMVYAKELVARPSRAQHINGTYHATKPESQNQSLPAQEKH